MSIEPDKNCTKVVNCPMRVRLPMTITPCVKQGEVTVVCGGISCITTDDNECPGVSNGSCTFTLVQDLQISVPIELGAESVIGNPHVRCMNASVGDGNTETVGSESSSNESGCLKKMSI